MNNSDLYKDHWQDEKHIDAFTAFKNFTLRSEEDFAVQCARLLAHEVPETPVTLLDIGVGNGLVTSYFLPEFVKCKSVKKYLGIDISTDLIEQASQKMSALKDSVPIELRREDALVFHPADNQDLIYAFNSWYGIPFERIVDFRKKLNSHGILAILLNSESNITIDVTQQFKPEESVTSSEQLMRWLTAHEIPFDAHLITTKFTGRESFLDSYGLRSESLGFFEYLLRGDVTRANDIGEYIKNMPDEYFNLPQHLILIRAS